jgi:hypothetical protein
MKICLFLSPKLKRLDIDFIIRYINAVYQKIGIVVELFDTKTTLCEPDLDIMKANLPLFDGVNVLITPSSSNTHGLSSDSRTWIRMRDTNISYSKNDFELLAFIICHELGHLLGLGHQIRPEGADKEDLTKPDAWDNMVMQYKLYNTPSIEEIENLSANELFPVVPEKDTHKKWDIYKVPEGIIYPIDKDSVDEIANCFCWTHKWLRENTFGATVSTYNGDDLQGYRHSAIDFSVKDPDADNWFVNPFPGVTKVTSVVNDYPDDYGQEYPNGKTYTKEEEIRIRKGQRGNYIELKYFIDGDTSHDYPSNVITCYGCHLKQHSAVVKVGDLVEQGQKLGKVGWSGYSSKPGAHIHFEMKVRAIPVDLFHLGVFKKEDFEFSYGEPFKYPDFYKSTVKNLTLINGSQEVTSEFNKEYDYRIESYIPIHQIIHDKNPFGEVFDFDLLTTLEDVTFNFSSDRKICEFEFTHHITEVWEELSRGRYRYYVVDDEGNVSEPFYIKLI